MQLYLIRHAESENNARPAYQRIEDPSITAVGRLQAEHLATWARSLRIDTLVCSPFLRTLQTALPIAKTIDLPAHIWHDIYERGGCYRGHGDDAKEGGLGMNGAAIRLFLPRVELDATIGEQGWWAGRPRETHEQAELRAAAVERRLIDTFGNNGRNVVVITHADFKRQLLARMLDGVVDARRIGPMRNTGVTKLNYDGQAWQLDWLNSVTHLPSRLITGVE